LTRSSIATTLQHRKPFLSHVTKLCTCFVVDLGAPVAAFSDEGSLAPASAPVAGFEQFAAEGGTMKTDPQCFFDQCGPQTKACFTNPSCLKGITCLGNCRGEQLCATQCFARFGSERLNNWLSCTLEDKQCVVTGVAQVLQTCRADANLYSLASEGRASYHLLLDSLQYNAE